MSEYTPSEVILNHPFEKSENPQAYDQNAYVYVSNTPSRHILGVVGGNEVSLIKGNRVDLESDLRGITRPNTWCATRKHLPQTQTNDSIERTNPKNNITINTTPKHLPTYQMWAYPVTYAPLPMINTTCKMPEKY